MKEVGAQRTGLKIFQESGTPETLREHNIIKDAAQSGEGVEDRRKSSEEQEWKKSYAGGLCKNCPCNNIILNVEKELKGCKPRKTGPIRQKLQKVR